MKKPWIRAVFSLAIPVFPAFSTSLVSLVLLSACEGKKADDTAVKPATSAAPPRAAPARLTRSLRST